VSFFIFDENGEKGEKWIFLLGDFDSDFLPLFFLGRQLQKFTL
jgi:hypothetical protein